MIIRAATINIDRSHRLKSRYLTTVQYTVNLVFITGKDMIYIDQILVQVQYSLQCEQVIISTLST